MEDQIDYIVAKCRFLNSINNVKTYLGADINSDHNPVVATLKLSLGKFSKPRERNSGMFTN